MIPTLGVFAVFLILIVLLSLKGPMKLSDSVVCIQQNWKVDVGVEFSDLKGRRKSVHMEINQKSPKEGMREHTRLTHSWPILGENSQL